MTNSTTTGGGTAPSARRLSRAGAASPVAVCAIALLALALGCRSHPASLRGANAGAPAAISIAVVPFGLMRGSPPAPIDVAEAIAADLTASGRFAALDTDLMPAQPTDVSEISFEQWRERKVDYVVVGLVGQVHDGGHDVEFRVVDTRSKTSVVGYQVPSAPDELHETARQVASIIDERLTGSVGVAAD